MNLATLASRIRDLRMPDEVSIGSFSIHVATDDLQGLQLGYSVDAENNALTGDQPGDWNPSWLVIGQDGLMDPIFVDLDGQDSPVMSAEHGTGAWDANLIAPSLRSFACMLVGLQELAASRPHPVAMEANPVTAAEFNAFAKLIRTMGGAEEWWTQWLTTEENG